MAGVLTTASEVRCGHSTGRVGTASTAKLRVQGSAALVQGSVVGKSVSDCGTAANLNAGDAPCLAVTAVTAGQAVKLRAGGSPVLLDTLAGGTSGTVGGTPQTLLAGTAGQSKLRVT